MPHDGSIPADTDVSSHVLQKVLPCSAKCANHKRMTGHIPQGINEASIQEPRICLPHLRQKRCFTIGAG